MTTTTDERTPKERRDGLATIAQEGVLERLDRLEKSLEGRLLWAREDARRYLDVLDRIEAAVKGIHVGVEQLLRQEVARQVKKDWYDTHEFAALTGKKPFAIRMWCREGRIRARKKLSGRGPHQEWAISHQELERFRKEGLLCV
jgi:hypothetical protein